MNTQSAEKIYSDILYLPHHELTTRRRMPVGNRAASFSPFAALTGYDESIKEASRFTKERIELDDAAKADLNDKLNIAISKAENKPILSITYFLPDKRKKGGEYVTVKGVILRIDTHEKRIFFADHSSIPIDDIYEIDGDIYDDSP